MMLNEDNYIGRISALTKKDWQPLLDLISEIEATSKFGEWVEIKKVDGVILMPGMNLAPIVSQFLNIVYDLPIIISFDWGSWQEGRKIMNDKVFNYDAIDISTKCKLITAIVRSDRFSEGALVSAFESGLMLKILKSIERQIE